MSSHRHCHTRPAAVAATLVLLALIIPSASASRAFQPPPLMFTLTQSHIAQPVDYETWCGDCIGVDYTTGSPWVVNPSGCMWDSDDFYKYDSAGSSTVLDAGASASVNACRYSSGSPQPGLKTDILIYSSSPSLIVSEAWSWDGGSVSTTITPTPNSAGQWRYFDCIESPSGAGAPFVTIPDSHGGTAIPQRITVTVSNPTSHRAGKTGGVIESGVIAGDQRGCTHWRAP